MFVWHALTNGKGVVDRPRPSQGLRDVPPKIATSGLANASMATACRISSVSGMLAHALRGLMACYPRSGRVAQERVSKNWGAGMADSPVVRVDDMLFG
jgi:hypothetical protein